MPTSAATVPLAYTAPPWPSLYWPINNSPGASYYLYYTSDIWRFTLYWNLIFYSSVHLAVSVLAVLMQLRTTFTQQRRSRQRGENSSSSNNNKKSKSEHPPPAIGLGGSGSAGLDDGIPLWIWAIPLVYVVIGLLEAVFAGSLVGLILGAVYNAGYFKMSTWMPFLWGLINVLVLILSSFSIHGGL